MNISNEWLKDNTGMNNSYSFKIHIRVNYKIIHIC